VCHATAVAGRVSQFWGTPALCALCLARYARACGRLTSPDEFRDWYEALTDDQQDAVNARVDVLEQQGPSLRRPAVGEIKGSAYDLRMKELRCSRDGVLRILFIFDPHRTAILLVGGDKTGRWLEWYRDAIPRADRLYAACLDEVERQKEGGV